MRSSVNKSDRDQERILSGREPLLTGHEELFLLVRKLQGAFPEEPPTAEVEKAHLAAIAAAARHVAEEGEPLATPARSARWPLREGFGPEPTRRRSMSKQVLTSAVAKVALSAVCGFAAFGGIAGAGALPQPVQSAAATAAGYVGVELPAPGQSPAPGEEAAEHLDPLPEQESPQTQDPEPGEGDQATGDRPGEGDQVGIDGDGAGNEGDEAGIEGDKPGAEGDKPAGEGDRTRAGGGDEAEPEDGDRLGRPAGEKGRPEHAGGARRDQEKPGKGGGDLRRPGVPDHVQLPEQAKVPPTVPVKAGWGSAKKPPGPPAKAPPASPGAITGESPRLGGPGSSGAEEDEGNDANGRVGGSRGKPAKGK
jgi:hypothetical protein